jgi:hypothetical protein
VALSLDSQAGVRSPSTASESEIRWKCSAEGFYVMLEESAIMESGE